MTCDHYMKRLEIAEQRIDSLEIMLDTMRTSITKWKTIALEERSRNIELEREISSYRNRWIPTANRDTLGTG